MYDIHTTCCPTCSTACSAFRSTSTARLSTTRIFVLERAAAIRARVLVGGADLLEVSMIGAARGGDGNFVLQRDGVDTELGAEARGAGGETNPRESGEDRGCRTICGRRPGCRDACLWCAGLRYGDSWFELVSVDWIHCWASTILRVCLCQRLCLVGEKRGSYIIPGPGHTCRRRIRRIRHIRRIRRIRRRNCWHTVTWQSNPHTRSNHT